LAGLIRNWPRTTRPGRAGEGGPGRRGCFGKSSGGFGAIIALRPRGGAAAADARVAALRLWLPATSLGGVESSLERRRRFATEAPTVPEDLLRLSVGIEDVEDIWAALQAALDAGLAA
jgi:cystathionine gamma-synthase